MNKVHFSNKTNEWITPHYLFEQLNNQYHFTLDPCANSENAKCARYFDEGANGLKQSWDNERVFMNPPYSRGEIGKWIRKAYLESRAGAIVVCLIPARTDTKYWHDYVMKASEIYFINGRLRFSNATTNAPFPSAIVVFNSRRDMMPKFRTYSVRGKPMDLPEVEHDAETHLL